MTYSRVLIAVLAFVLLLGGGAGGAARAADTPRRGGVLVGVLPEDLPTGFSIHEAATISAVWPLSPCYSNLVIFDPLKAIEKPETVIPELAERWSWQDNYRNLVLFLRRNVKWHDGQPFTSKDVKYTFDMLRESPDATAKLRLNPRKDWYSNIERIEAAEPHTVVFHLKRPQPSLLLMLASGYSPVYPAHVTPAELRQRCVGTGPFRVKEWRRGEFLEYVRNPDYFIPGRPYLDGIKYLVISERGVRYSAIQAGRADMAFPEGPRGVVEGMKKAVPRLVVQTIGTTVYDNVILNTTKPPFDNVTVRRAISMGLDRKAYLAAVHEGAAAVGTTMTPPPYGTYGLLPRDLASLPGYGPKPADDKARARMLLAQAGYTASSPLKVEVLTRTVSFYLDYAAWIVSELKSLGIEATLRQIETPQWHPMASRKDYQIGANLTGVAIDDPDVNYYENHSCSSIRNYTGYCDETVQRLIDQQSQELDPKKRLALVWDIQRKLESAAARPVLGWRINYYVHWPHVKNLVHHNSIFNFGRMQDVWLDRDRS